MSDTGLPPEHPEALPQGAHTAGAVLRHAREAAGVHIGALAVALKVPVKKLEALEADRIDLLPDAVFARALAASVCRTLKIDPAEVMRLLPQSGRPNLEFAARPASAVVHSRAADPGKGLMSRLSLPVVLGAGVLVIATVVLLLFPDFDASLPQADTPVAEGASGTGSAGSPAPVGTAAVPPAVAAPEALPAPPPPATQFSASMPPAAAPAATASSPPAAAAAVAGNEPLTLLARSATWVQVTDAAGATPLRRTLAEGESVAVSGALPLSVVVGRADAIQVQVRGEPLDLAAATRNNIARFQVK